MPQPPQPSDYEPDLVVSQADLDQQWAQAYDWARNSSGQSLYEFFDLLNSSSPQRLTQQQWDILSCMGILVLQQSLLHNFKELPRER